MATAVEHMTTNDLLNQWRYWILALISDHDKVIVSHKIVPQTK